MLSLLASLLVATSLAFSSPVHDTILLAGNFGEPRPNHFHGGIDVKTGGVEGKPIFAVADGYVSHVSVGLYGFGNAVYVHHPSGHTSVYCHLRSFVPQMAAMVRKWQYQHHSATGLVTFRPGELPVAEGQLIAVSGNTGASTAPHLHLEIHDTESGDLLDPLDFLGDLVSDATPPTVHAVMAYPVPGEGQIRGQGAGGKEQEESLFSRPLPLAPASLAAWGKVGFGIWANDYMEGTHNYYGIKNTDLYVDDRLVFHSDVSRVAPSQHLQVNAWGDYAHYCQRGVWYMRSFLLPGLTLPMLETDSLCGIVDFCEERDYHLRYVLTDFKGNQTEHAFVVRGERMEVPRAGSPMLHRLYAHRPNVCQIPGMQLYLRSGLLADDLSLSPQIVHQQGALSARYQLTSRSTPLLDAAALSLRVDRPVGDSSKLYMVCHGKTDRPIGGTYADGWLTAKIRDLGAAYEVCADHHAPTIAPMGEASWAATGIVRLSMVDDESGIASYEGYLDNQFVLFEAEPRSAVVHCNLRETPVRPTGRPRTLKVVVRDHVGNQQTFTNLLRY